MVQKNYENSYHTLLTLLFSSIIYHFLNSCQSHTEELHDIYHSLKFQVRSAGCWISNFLWPLVRPMFPRHFKICFSKIQSIILDLDHQFKTTEIGNEVLHHQNKLFILRFEAWLCIYSWAITQTIWQIDKLFFYKESCFQKS